MEAILGEQLPLFAVEIVPFRPDVNGRVHLSMRVTNPSDRQALQCTATIRQYRLPGSAVDLLNMLGHQFAWETLNEGVDFVVI